MIGSRAREKLQPLLIIAGIRRSGAFSKDLEGKSGDKTLKFVLGVWTSYFVPLTTWTPVPNDARTLSDNSLILHIYIIIRKHYHTSLSLFMHFIVGFGIMLSNQFCTNLNFNA